ncbi:hypothetical protein AVEN_260207-1 [Araneus ventricosus]|uniref:Uncharacterized protein n=1 Tax=Araneus ventricosus TaxID=182803 RepID=A0A4Y2Q334_ARAVE|nr:hypothetical protein AVEN_260207-1 [Araneus ventricosus]
MRFLRPSIYDHSTSCHFLAHPVMTTPRQAIFGTDEHSTESKSIRYKPLRSPNALISTPGFKARTPAFSAAPAVQMELLDIETFAPHHTSSDFRIDGRFWRGVERS